MATVGFTLVEVMVVILMIGVFALCVWPAARVARQKREVKQTLAIGAELRKAILDANRPVGTAGQVRAIWPTNYFRSSTEYFKALFDTNRLNAPAPLHLFAAPGIPAWTGSLASLTESNVAWCIVQSDGSVGTNDMPFLYTRNLIASRGEDKVNLTDLDALDPKARPLADRCAVVVSARGNVRLIQPRMTNENLQKAVNPYGDTNDVLKVISMKRVAPPPEKPKRIGAISGNPLNAAPVYQKKQKER